MPSEKVQVHEAAKILDVSPDTIRRWAKKGLIREERSPNNHRLFNLDELLRVKNKSQSGAGYRILKSEPTDFNVVELFSGAGGMALGFENAGLKSELLVEIDKHAVATLAHNFPNKKIIHDDVANVDFTAYRDKVDIVAGGFPCQSFSYAGKSLGFEDTRGTLFFEFARAVKEIRPLIALGENVRGLLKHDKGRTLHTMEKVLHDLGYRVEVKLLKAQFFDVPQKRERIFIQAIRNDIDVPFLFPRERDYIVTLKETIADCPPSEGATYPEHKRQVMELVPPGGYWRDLPDDIQKEYMGGSYHLGGGKTGMARRLSWDEPSLTLTTSPAQKQTERCHPAETRPLNIREYARIQTFPDDWEFQGSMAAQYKQIGNAVPVNLAYHVGRALIEILRRAKYNSSPAENYVEIEQNQAKPPKQLPLL